MFDVRPTENLEDFQRALLAIGQYFGAEPTPERAEKFSQSLPFERMHAAREDGAIVGGAGVFPFEMAVPGGIVRCAGVTVVGVYPTHRRRGVLRAMMRAQLDDIHARGEPIAALWASEETIYGRFGYGMASYTGEISLAREHSEFAHPFEPRGRLRLLEPDEALEQLPPIWERALQQTPGMFRRERPWWENRVVHDPPERREGGGPKRFALLELDGEPQAYAIYRHNPKWDEGSSAAQLGIVEAIGATPRGTAEIWRFLLDIDWQASISADLLPIDHPLFFLLAKPRRMKYRAERRDLGAHRRRRCGALGSLVRARRRSRVRGRRRVRAVERRSLEARRRLVRANGRRRRPALRRDRARLRVPRRLHVRRAGARSPRGGASGRRNRPRRLDLPPHRARALVPRDLLSYPPSLREGVGRRVGVACAGPVRLRVDGQRASAFPRLARGGPVELAVRP